MDSGMFLVLVSLPFCYSSPVEVGQSRRVSVHVGSTALLECWLEGEEPREYSIHWFKQVPGSAPSHILSQANNSSIHRTDPFAERFQPIRSNSSNFLRVSRVTTSDSALYWCAVTRNSTYPVWGNGTKLSVSGGRDVLAPTVTLLSSVGPPGSTSLLLCLVTNFYPPVIEVTWQLDGRDDPADTIAGPSFSGRDKSYSLTSIMEVSIQQRRNFSSISCQVRHESSKTLISKNMDDCYRNPLD